MAFERVSCGELLVDAVVGRLLVADTLDNALANTTIGLYNTELRSQGFTVSGSYAARRFDTA